MLQTIKKALGLTQSDETLASIVYWAGDARRIPRGFMLCDGRMLDTAKNPALFSIIGNRYGGDGRSTFALPDLRVRDSKGNVDPADPWHRGPVILICVEGVYPFFD